MNFFYEKPSEQQIPEIPDIPKDLLLPIETLVRLAYMFRGVFMQAVYGKSLSEIIVEQRDFLLLADKVLNASIYILDLHVDQ